MKDKMNVVISGANITVGGPRTIYLMFLRYFNDKEEYNVTAFVNNKIQFQEFSKINFIELKWYKKFIPLKLYYEYLYYFFYSKKLKCDIWISLSDCTPFVETKLLVSYFHNALSTHKFKLIEIYFSPLLFFQKFYSYIFILINIHRNSFVIVQQSWFRKYISESFNYNLENIIVCPPLDSVTIPNHSKNDVKMKAHLFICPIKPVFYKNIEVVFKAFEVLNKSKIYNYRFYITINGCENAYSKYLYRKYKHLKNIHWCGALPMNELSNLYIKCNTLVFLSNLESWGLPLTEAIHYELNIIANEIEYSRESISDYKKVNFINGDDSIELSELLKSYIDSKNIKFSITNKPVISMPYFSKLDKCISYLKGTIV